MGRCDLRHGEIARRRLNQKFRRWLNGERVICLDIPDEYTLMQPELVERLVATAGRHLR